MSAQRQHSNNRIAILSITEGRVRRFWVAVLAMGAYWFGYYFFAEVWPSLLPAGWG